MRDEVRERLKGIGKMQRRILLWLGSQQGVKTPDDLRSRWPETQKVQTRAGALMEVIEAIQTQKRHTEVPTEYSPYFSDSYFLDQEDLRLESEGWIRWGGNELLGRQPTQNESVTVSKGLRGLVDRDLIETARTGPKGKRVSHAKLTFYGEVAAVLLAMESEQLK